MERHKPADFSLDLTGVLLQTNLVSYRGVPFELTGFGERKRANAARQIRRFFPPSPFGKLRGQVGMTSGAAIQFFPEMTRSFAVSKAG
jgi:hypothetical protein